MPYSVTGTKFDVATRPYSTHSPVATHMYVENMQTPDAQWCCCYAARHICIRFADTAQLVREGLWRFEREMFSIGNRSGQRKRDRLMTERAQLFARTNLHIACFRWFDFFLSSKQETACRYTQKSRLFS